MTTSEQWIREIEDACAEPERARSNQSITRLHYLLSEALANGLGREGGPNFHSWAVWGSRKAGVTIRQEDLDSAITTATVTAAVVGSLVGAATAGRKLAIWSREKASKLTLRGNQIVIQEIGGQSARFLELLENGATGEGRAAFFARLRPGPTERHGQERLATAFRSYLAAFDSNDLDAKRAAMIAGNCEIVYHEHIRLEPYIRGAMPFIIRRCVTRRWMTYKIGERVLAVCEDLPGIPTPTAASNWAKFEERMHYVFALFKMFHNAPEVFATPFPETEIAQMRESEHHPG